MKDLFKKYQLPKKVDVILSQAKEGGFVVEFPDLSGCFTQVEHLSELDEKVTDAILTYFDVPRSKANKMAYIPEIKKRPIITPAQTSFDLFVAA